MFRKMTFDTKLYLVHCGMINEAAIDDDKMPLRYSIKFKRQFAAEFEHGQTKAAYMSLAKSAVKHAVDCYELQLPHVARHPLYAISRVDDKDNIQHMICEYLSHPYELHEPCGLFDALYRDVEENIWVDIEHDLILFTCDAALKEKIINAFNMDVEEVRSVGCDSVYIKSVIAKHY